MKSRLLPSLRSETAAHHVGYIDACYVLTMEEAAAPLLGSGGNDGSRDFGVNFAEKLQELVDFRDGSPTARARTELESALLDVVRRAAEHGSMGQFSPGQGGPNGTTGYEGYNPLNAWDVILAMEGTMAFAGALTRQWGATGGSRAAFPFTFEPTGAGAGGLSSEDPNRPRGEVWTPIWSKPATFSEAAAIFAEGRLTVGERTARKWAGRGTRSVARIGAARGIGWFRALLHHPARQQDAVPGDTPRPIRHAGSTAQGPRLRPRCRRLAKPCPTIGRQPRGRRPPARVRRCAVWKTPCSR